MPSFTKQLPDLIATGPLTEVQFVISQALEDTLVSAGEPIPAPVQATALIDTGVSATVIQHGIAYRLGLKPVGQIEMNTPSSTNVPCYTYAIRVVFPNNVLVGGITAVQAPLEGQNIEALIGRDILRLGVLVYTGYMNQFTLSF